MKDKLKTFKRVQNYNYSFKNKDIIIIFTFKSNIKLLKYNNFIKNKKTI